MGQNYSIKLGVTLDESSITKIKSDLENKLKNSSDVEIKFNASGLDEISKKADKVSSSLNKASKQSGFDKTSTTAKNAAKNVGQLNDKLDNTNKKMKYATFATGNWAYSWSKAMQSFLTYMSVTQLFNQVSNGIQDMIMNVKELDDSLTELKKVTDLEGESLNKFVDEAYAVGATVAKTGTEMVQAATSFAKAGYGEDEILQLGKVATMYQNIADEEIDAGEAADFIIAQLKAFNLEADNANDTLENAYHVIDAVNEVSNNFAVSSSDIATNLGKASAVMSGAGNSLEQMIGLMTAGTEITRNASRVANGLKTITLRLQGMNDEGEEDLELMASMESLFNKLGISVYGANGELKNTYEILDTLAPVYAKLDNAQKAFVTETIAGKYQAQNASAILQNWSTAIKATETAMNSQGSAAAENDKVLESVQGHLQALTSAWEDLSRNIISSDFLKFMIDLGTAFLNITNSGIGKFLIKIAAMITVLKLSKSIFQQLEMSIKKTAATQLLMASNSSKVTKEMIKEKTAAMTLGGAFKQLGVKAKASMAAMAASPLGWITIGITLISALTSAYKAWDEAQHEAAQKTVDDAQSLTNKLEDIDSMSSKIEELRKVTDSSTSSYEDATKAREELNSIQKQLIEDYGAESDKIDLVNGSIEEQIKYLKELKKEAAEDYLSENRDEYKTAKSKIYSKKNARSLEGSSSLSATGTSNNINKYNAPVKSITFLDDEDGKKRKKYIEEQKFMEKYISDYEKIMSKYGKVKKTVDSSTGNVTDMSFISTNVDKEKKALEEWKKYLKDNEKDIVGSGIMSQDEFDSALKYTTDGLNKIEKKYGDFYKVLDEYQKKELAAKGYDDLIEDVKKLAETDELTEKNVKKLIKQYDGLDTALSHNKIKVSDIIKEYQNVGKVVSKNSKEIDKAITTFSDDGLTRSQILKLKDSKNATEEQKEAYDSLSKIASKSKISIKDLIDYLVTTGQVSKDTSEKVVESTSNIMSSFESSFSTVADKYGALTSAAEEFNENGYITVSTFKNLMDNNLWQYLDWTANGLNANTDALINEADAIKYNALISLQDAFAKDALAIATGDVSNQSEIAKAAVSGLKTEMDTAGKIAQARAGNLFTYAGAVEAIKNAEAGKDLSDEDIEKKKNALTNLANAYNNAAAGIANVNLKASAKSGSGSGSKSGSSKSEKEWWETELEKLKDQFNYSDITIEQYIDGLEKLLSKTKKGSDAWKKINEELQKQKLNKVKDDYDAGRISLEKYIKELEKLQQAYKKGTQGWNDLASAIKKAKLDLLKENEDKLKSALDAVTDALDDQIDKYEDLKEAADKRYEEEIKNLEDLQEELENQDDDYQRAQQAVLDYLDEQLDALNSQRDAIEDYYDTVIDALQRMNEEQERANALAEAYEELMNAMTQKTKKVWVEGVGWVWTQDQKAIDEAKKKYEDLLNEQTINDIEDQRDSALEALDDQIKALEDYVDSWESVLDKFETEKNKSLADLLLGENWEEMVDKLDPEIVNEFSDAYYELQKNLEETEKQIEELNKRKEEEDEYWDKLIEDLEEYKGQWEDIADIYQKAQDRLAAEQILGANWEADILQKRLDVLESFKNKYNKLLEEINKVENMSDDQASGYSSQFLHSYANGGEVNYTGLAMLHGTPNKPEYVLNNNQMRNLLSNLTQPQIASKYNCGQEAVINNYNFGNIELPNVNNAQQFVNELKSLLNISKHQ